MYCTVSDVASRSAPGAEQGRGKGAQRRDKEVGRLGVLHGVRCDEQDGTRCGAGTRRGHEPGRAAGSTAWSLA